MAIKIHVRTNILTANLRMSVRVVLCYNFTWLPVGGGGGGGGRPHLNRGGGGGGGGGRGYSWFQAMGMIE